MKKFYSLLIVLAVFVDGTAKAQQNVNNPGFENWDNLGNNTEEPTSWNSFMSASGPLTWAAQQQIKKSTQKRPGSPGNSSVVIWSRSTLGIVANGVVTTGQVNMGSSTPSNSSNYNITRTADANFSEAYTDDPDSIVFWVRFKPASGGTEQARMSAIMHDSYDYRDPNTSDGNAASHIVGTAALNFSKTNGLWERKAVAINYSGPASTHAFILISFTTNMTPGSGSAGDSLYIDDISFSYNTTGIQQAEETGLVSCYNMPSSQQICMNFGFDQSLQTKLVIYNIAGQMIWSENKEISNARETIDIETLRPGIYFLNVVRADSKVYTRKFVVN
jgi:hypothetical protein